MLFDREAGPGLGPRRGRTVNRTALGYCGIPGRFCILRQKPGAAIGEYDVFLDVLKNFQFSLDNWSRCGMIRLQTKNKIR